MANAGALRQLGFSTAQQRVPALVIPLWNVHGDVAFHQARPDYPRLRDGKPVKYETPNGAADARSTCTPSPGRISATRPGR